MTKQLTICVLSWSLGGCSGAPFTTLRPEGVDASGEDASGEDASREGASGGGASSEDASSEDAPIGTPIEASVVDTGTSQTPTDAPAGDSFAPPDTSTPPITTPDAAGPDASETDVACPTCTPSACPVAVVENTYDTTFDGMIAYTNTGAGDEVNPTVQFDLPAGATMYQDGCAWMDQTAPGCTDLVCSQAGTTVTYAFSGSLAAGAELQLYYSTDQATEPPATNIVVLSPMCP